MTGRSTKTFVTTIAKPPEVVFAYVSDVSKHGEWSPKPYRVEGSTGPVEAGDSFLSIGSVPGDNDHRNEVSVTDCVSPLRLVLDSTDKGEHYINTFELTADGAGTRLTRTFDTPRPSFPLSVVFPLIVAAIIKPDVNKGLANLKAILERG